MWGFGKKQKLKKIRLAYTNAVIIEFDEKIKKLSNDLKHSDTEIDIVKIKFAKLNMYLEAIVTIFQTHILDKDIKSKIQKLYADSKKIIINNL